MVPDLNAEKRGGLGKQKFLRASDCQHTKDVLKGMGPEAFLAYGGGH